MRNKFKLILVASLFVAMVCLVLYVVGQKEKIYEGDNFRFTIPSGWKTFPEIWGSPIPAGTDFYGLGVTTDITLQYPTGKGKGKAFFSVASGNAVNGESLEARVKRAYEDSVTEIKDLSITETTRGDMDACQVNYSRPWGEPWWTFQDLWLQKDDVVYVLSFHSSAGSFSDYMETVGGILDSFEFK